MDLFFMDDVHYMLKESVSKFAKKEIAPIAEEIDKKDEFPVDLFKKMGDMGFLGVTIPEEYGGSGMDILSAIIIGEEISKYSAAVALSFGAHSILCTHNLYLNGNEEQKRKYLPKLCSGEYIGALALTEPDAGSDAVSIRTKATKEGDYYILNGSKMFITNGPIADILIVYAKTAPEKGAKGISAFIVEKDFPGFGVSRKLEKMGMRGSPTGELFFDNCKVPAGNLLGKENEGVAVMMAGLDIERVALAGISLGIAQAAFDQAVEYAKTRVQFGRPIGAFQLIQEKLANMYTMIETARTFSYQVARLAEKAKSGGKGTEIHKKAAAVALYVGEMVNYVTYEALQIHGGYGYIKEFPIERMARDARLATIGAGTSEIRRLIIGREIMGL